MMDRQRRIGKKRNEAINNADSGENDHDKCADNDNNEHEDKF